MAIVEMPKLPQLHHLIGDARVSGVEELPVFNPSTGEQVAA